MGIWKSVGVELRNYSSIRVGVEGGVVKTCPGLSVDLDQNGAQHEFSETEH